MPSGSKKRKAARKKKEKGAANSANHPQGDADLKVSSTNSDEKSMKDPSSAGSENVSVEQIGKVMDEKHKRSSSSSSSHSGSGSVSSSGSSSDDELEKKALIVESNDPFMEKKALIVESNDPFIDQNSSDLPELIGEENNAAILEDTKLKVTAAVSEVPPFQDHEVKEEGEAISNWAMDQERERASLAEEEMGEEKYVVLEEKTTIVTPDQPVSNTIETSATFQEETTTGKDYQSTVIDESAERQHHPKVLQQRTSWASCCGLSELFIGTNR